MASGSGPSPAPTAKSLPPQTCKLFKLLEIPLVKDPMVGSGSGSQPREVGAAGGGPRLPIEPVGHPLDVECGGGGQMLQVGLGEPAVARGAQAADPHPLREGPLDPGPTGVGRGKVGGLLTAAAAWIASCSARGCSVRLRGSVLARVHWARTGQGVQSAAAKATWIKFRPPVWVWHQRTLLRPWGQVTPCPVQSSVKWLRSKPVPVLACHWGSAVIGPTRSMPCRSRLRTRVPPQT